MYVLEIGQLESIPLPYSYTRRAQASIHRMAWKQVLLCNEVEPLKSRASRMTAPGLEFRITGVGEHCLFETLTL